jgi:glycosyltransferase involved in cell wall biosynthesis
LIKMRVVQLVDSLDYGGAEQVAAGLAIGLQKRGHSVEIACLRGLGDQPVALPELQSAGVKVVPFHKPEGIHPPTIRKLAAWLKSGQTEVLNSHNPLVHHYAVAAGKMAGVPAILNTLHGTATLELQKWAKALYWLSCLFSDRVVAVCPEVEQVFRGRFRLPHARYTTVDNGVDLSGFLAVRRGARPGPVTLGTVGRLVPVKNHALLIEAFALARREHPDLRLQLLGGGPLENDLRRLADASGVSDAVEFRGFSTDVPGFLAGLDVYVLSSRSEGLPMSLLEAIASGLTVVATEVGGVPGVVAKTGGGWLCSPSDPAAMMRAMDAAIRCPDREARGERARHIAASWYSTSRMASDYENLYKGLLGNRAGTAHAA